MRLLLATTALAVPMHGSALAHVVIAGGATETVNGAGGGTQASPWHIGGDLRLETATLDILNGGFVQSSAGKVGDTPGFDTPVGVVNITGALSRWQMLSGFSAGYNGSGTVIISGGGQMESTQGNLAILSGSLGTVTVTGADSTWKNFGYVVIGDAGTGTLEILDGGSVSNTDATLSAALGGRGSVRVAGEDSYWYSSGILRVARDYVGVLVVADGGTVEVDGSVIIADLGTSGGRIVIGDEYWNTPVAPGTLIASEVSFGAGSGGLVFNHTAEKYGFGADVSGDGTIGVYSGTTSLSGDSSDFVGIATVQSGTLLVNGLLGGTTAVNGTLGGAGVVANASIRASGTLAPGNSIGKLTVTTDLIFDDDSRYEVEVNDGGNTPGVNNDFTYVGGTLTIGNDVFVSVIPANGTDDGSTYTPGLVYTILTADGGIAGTFALAKTKMAFLTPELSYDANNVYLELTLNGGGDGDGDGGDGDGGDGDRDGDGGDGDGDGGGGGGGGGSSGHVGFGDVANTQNQKGVGNALENFGPGHPLYDEIIMMTEEEARAAYDALSGEAHASSSTSQFMTAGEIRQQLLDRLAAILGAGGGGLASLAHAPAAGDAAPGTASVWGQLFGSWGRTDGNAVAASIDRDAYGFIGGIDREIVPGVRAGIAAGYSRSTYDVAARSSSGDSDNFHLAGYAGTALGAFDVKGVVSYGYGKVRAERTVIVGGLTNNLSADYATHTFQAGLEAGYDLDLGSLVLTPFAGLAGVHVETEGFTETGGPAALTFGSTSTTTGVSTLGLRARRQAGSVGLTAAAAWRHAFGDVEPTSRAAFASAPAATFAVRGTPIAENALALDAAIDAKLGADTTLTFGYAGELASDARDHGLRAELRVEF